MKHTQIGMAARREDDLKGGSLVKKEAEAREDGLGGGWLMR